jgi:hypothetical protein
MMQSSTRSPTESSQPRVFCACVRERSGDEVTENRGADGGGRQLRVRERVCQGSSNGPPDENAAVENDDAASETSGC